MRQTRILVHNSTLVVLILAQKQDQQLQVGSNEEKRCQTVNHSKQAGGDNNINMVELRILYKSTNNETIQTS
jgi:hypothetical protein